MSVYDIVNTHIGIHGRVHTMSVYDIVNTHIGIHGIEW